MLICMSSDTSALPFVTQTRLGRERHECKFEASAINWLAKRPRWHVHLTPTSSSWLNQVERFFAHIAERKIRRGIYRSVAALRAEITSFIEYHNADPRPFRWTKSADDILSSIERFCAYNSPAKV
jgi:hypothetical protein